MIADETARRLVAQALQCAPDMVGMADDIGTLEGWTSLAHLRLILEIETTIGRMIAPEVIVELTSVASVAAILEEAARHADATPPLEGVMNRQAL